MPKNPHAVALGRKGGQARSAAKTKAVRENAKKGGWPKGKPRKAHGAEPMTDEITRRDEEGWERCDVCHGWVPPQGRWGRPGEPDNGDCQGHRHQETGICGAFAADDDYGWADRREAGAP